MGERVVNMTIRFFVGVWVVRYLGPEQYGVYSYALSFVGLFTAVTTLGLDGIVIRNLSSEEWSEGEVMGTAFGLRMGAAVLTMGAVAATVFSVNDQWVTQVAVLIVSGQLVFKSADVFRLWFKSEIMSKYPVWVRSGVVLVNSATQVAFILLGLPVLAFVVLYLVQSSLKAGGTFLMYQMVSGQGGASWTFRWSAARTMMQDAWPLIFAGLSVSVYMKIDQVMLGEMVGESAVGIYATAVKISELWYFIPAAIAGSAFPKIVSSKETASADIYRDRMQALYDSVVLISYLVIVPILFSAEFLIDLLFGQQYANSAPILQVHIWALLFASLGVARRKWMVTENLTYFAMFSAMLGAVINVMLNLLLIQNYSGIGAAFATLFSYSASSYFSLIVWRRLWGTFKQLSMALVVPFRLRSSIRGIKRVMRG